MDADDLRTRGDVHDGRCDVGLTNEVFVDAPDKRRDTTMIRIMVTRSRWRDDDHDGDDDYDAHDIEPQHTAKRREDDDDGDNCGDGQTGGMRRPPRATKRRPTMMFDCGR